jgi:molybdopterin-guanine dinucleotide biosynthesis protein A
MTALKAARNAAAATFDAYLTRTKSTATPHVPAEVIKAAKDAYAAAGGMGEIVVAGHGNRTHPVCSVSVRKATKADLAAR